MREEEKMMGGDNGKLEPQPAPPEMPEGKITVLVIKLDKKTQRVEIEGMIGNKALCFNVIAEAIKTIANFDPSPIIKPQGGILGFARKFVPKRG